MLRGWRYNIVFFFVVLLILGVQCQRPLPPLTLENVVGAVGNLVGSVLHPPPPGGLFGPRGMGRGPGPWGPRGPQGRGPWNEGPDGPDGPWDNGPGGPRGSWRGPGGGGGRNQPPWAETDGFGSEPAFIDEEGPEGAGGRGQWNQGTGPGAIGGGANANGPWNQGTGGGAAPVGGGAGANGPWNQATAGTPQIGNGAQVGNQGLVGMNNANGNAPPQPRPTNNGVVPPSNIPTDIDTTGVRTFGGGSSGASSSVAAPAPAPAPVSTAQVSRPASSGGLFGDPNNRPASLTQFRQSSG